MFYVLNIIHHNILALKISIFINKGIKNILKQLNPSKFSC